MHEKKKRKENGAYNGNMNDLIRRMRQFAVFFFFSNSYKWKKGKNLYYSFN